MGGDTDRRVIEPATGEFNSTGRPVWWLFAIPTIVVLAVQRPVLRSLNGVTGDQSHPVRDCNFPTFEYNSTRGKGLWKPIAITILSTAPTTAS